MRIFLFVIILVTLVLAFRATKNGEPLYEKKIYYLQDRDSTVIVVLGINFNSTENHSDTLIGDSSVYRIK